MQRGAITKGNIILRNKSNPQFLNLQDVNTV